MRTGNIVKRGATIAIILALCVAFLPGPAPVQAAVGSGDGWTIVFDYTHGQHSGSVEYMDEWLEGNLSALGFTTVVWALGGLNDSILAGADALVIGGTYGNNGFTAAEVTAVGSWFNAGSKFLWVGGDSDYDGTAVTNNMTLILEEVGSHVYHEPTSVEDPISCCASGYRVVANTTSDDAFVAGIVEGVDAVLMHGPTLLYGSDSDTPGEDVDPVALETASIDDVYPLLYYGGNATITDGDITYPYAHTDGDVGSFVATTMEINAGDADTGVIVVSGASPYGDYRPMYSESYYNVTLTGYYLVNQAIYFGTLKATTVAHTGNIVFDYSHGQHSSSVEYMDVRLQTILTMMGYTVTWASSGLTTAVLADADALIIGGIYGDNGFTAAEITAVGDWFSAGNRFLWVGGDSDYDGANVGNNMTLILEEVGSHVYHEPTAIEDPISCCASGYRVVANTTSDNAFVAGFVEGVDAVLMHGPTMLYGSNNATPGENVNPVALETVSIPNVYPLLYYGGNATITDGDITYPYAHTDGDVGSFVATTLEVLAGEAGTGVIIVSGASPYGDYRPMITHSYYDIPLNGENLVVQGIVTGLDWAVNGLPSDMTMIYIAAAIGVVVIVIVVIVVMKKR